MNSLLEHLGLTDVEEATEPLLREATARTRREQLLAVVFYRFAEIYDKTFYKTLRRFTEFSMLIHSLLAFATLTALHFTYVNNPSASNCLADIDVPRGTPTVLRIEVRRLEVGLPSSGPPDTRVVAKDRSCDSSQGGEDANSSSSKAINPNIFNASHSFRFRPTNPKLIPSDVPTLLLNAKSSWLETFNREVDRMLEKILSYVPFNPWCKVPRSEGLVVEYSESSGLLLLSSEAREKLGVRVMKIVLDPDTNRCFGTSVYKRVFLEELFGFRDVVTISLENFLIANDMTEGYFRISDGSITKLSTERTTPLPRTIVAATSMMIFMACSSLLLQFSYNTISSAVVDLVYFNSRLRSFPIGPMIVSVIAIIGFRDLMKYMFYDNLTFTLNLLIIWMANQFYTFFCHCNMSKRHWLKFFFLYHFVFYIYYVRHKGKFSLLAMTTNWFFIQHSKMYFFHHYELPAMHSRLRVRRALAELRRNGSSIMDRFRLRGPATPRVPQARAGIFVDSADSDNNNIISSIASNSSSPGNSSALIRNTGTRIRLTFMLREPR